MISPSEKRGIRQGLLRWFRAGARDLPWRRTRDPYAVWLSEIMLQQTRVEQGLPYFERFVAALPDVKALAAAREDTVLKLWEGLGYYSRARNLHRAAKQIVKERAGRFPTTAAEWLELPGIGRYTAGAIASIAFGERAAVLDGNVKRVLSRLFDIGECIDETATQHRLWSLAESLVPEKAPGDFNQGMMELGARVCVPRLPRCSECPVRRCCRACAAGTQAQRPVRRAGRKPPHHEVVVAVINRRGRYLLGKRPHGGMLGGLWEFPGGKIEPGETHHEALVREMREELGVKVHVGTLLATVSHAYSHFRVTLHVYRCEITGGAPSATTHTLLKWVPRSKISEYALPQANRKFLAAL